MSKTLGDLIKRKQNNKFIGRSEHIAFFKNNLNAQEDDRIPIFNIYGQGGVGKSHLSQHYKTWCIEEHKYLTVYTDDTIKSLLDWMAAVSEQFKNQEAELHEFDKRYKVYLQETKKLETDPDKPKGTFGSIMKGISKVAMKEGKKLPGGELIAALINEEKIAETIGEWSEFVRKKLTNKDEVDLVLEPVKVLTPLFWKGMTHNAKHHHLLCFFIDTFEETDSYLEMWLLDLFNEKYGNILPANILFVIAGRDELNANKWSAFSGLTHTISLEPFSEEDAFKFLNAHNIKDEVVQSDIIKLSGRLPVLMDWLAHAAVSGNKNMNDACDTAVERFLQWVTDDTQRSVALDAALPRKLNQDIIASFLTDSSKAKTLFDWLCKQPFVIKKGNYWTYHNVVREQMLRYVRTHSPKDWIKKHLQLAEFYEDLQKDLELDTTDCFIHPTWLDYEYERLYHSLCAKPGKNISNAIKFFLKLFREKSQIDTFILGEALEKAGIDNEDENIKNLGFDIKAASLALRKEEIIVALYSLRNILSKQSNKDEEMLVDFQLLDSFVNLLDSQKPIKFLNSFEFNENKSQSFDVNLLHAIFLNLGQVINMDEGSLERLQDKFLKKIQKLKNEFENNMINDPLILNTLGLGCLLSGLHDKAIELYTKSIEIKKDNYSAFYGIMRSYYLKADEDLALYYFRIATKLKLYTYADYNDINKIGKNPTLESYQKVLNIRPDDYLMFLDMGDRFFYKKELVKAIECYKNATDIKPDYYEAYYDMGLAYFYNKDKEAAVESFKKSIAIKPDYNDAHNSLGFALLSLRQIEEAEKILLKSSELGGYYATKNLGHVYLFKGQREKALSYYRAGLEAFPSPDEFWERMQDDFQYLTQYDITDGQYAALFEEIKIEKD